MYLFNVIVILLCACTCSVSALTQEERQHIVDEHNRFRREAGAPDMLLMEYDTDLECVAQNYIETQTIANFEHNPNRGPDYAACGGSGSVGENWYSGNHAQAVDQWANLICCGNTCGEKDVYIGTAGCTGITGHYTQIMWASSYKVGCGYTPEGGTVCNYSPAGNSGSTAWQGAPGLDLGNECDSCDQPPINNTHPHCFENLCSQTSDGRTPGRGGSDVSEMNAGAAYFLLVFFGCLLCTTVVIIVVAVVVVVVLLGIGTGGTVAFASGAGGKLNTPSTL